MPKTIKSHNKIFIFLLVLIVVISNALTFFISSYQTALIEHQNTLDNMRQTLQEMRRIATESDNIPTSINTPFMTYVLNQTEGTFIVPRITPLSRSEKDLWDYHRTKLIYQMQKQREGEIHYPKQTGLLDRLSGNNTIFFTTLPQRGWIIVIEAYMESPLQIFFSRITFSHVLNIMAILILSVICVVFFVNRTLTLLSKLISDHLESGLVQMNNATDWSEPMIRQDPTPEIKKPPKMNIIPADHVLNIELSENIEAPDDTSAPFGLALNTGQKADPLTTSKPEQSFLAAQERNAGPAPKDTAPGKPKVKKKLTRAVSQSTEPEPGYNDLTLNLQDIKSPVLKKMIHKLRNPK